MRVLFSKRLPWVFLLVLILCLGAFFAYQAFFTHRTLAGETTEVSYGDVSVITTVSGVVHADNSAELAFPQSGIVRSVLVREGETVTEGQILASLGQETLTAEYNDAVAQLAFEEATLDELLRGPRDEARAVTDTSVAIAQKDLERTTAEQDILVENARRALLSTGLEAMPFNKESNDPPPTVSGTYTCEREGSYIFSMYRSSSKSGYSYKLAGLESGTFSAYTDQPAPLGMCGLYIQFTDGEPYANQDWVIEIPNTRSSTYVTNKNAYELALQTRENAIEAASQALALAENEETLANAAPRTQEQLRAEARVEQARARLAAIEAKIADQTIRAPFDGVVTNVDIKVGDVGGATKSITMIRDNSFTIKALIPEADVTKVAEGNTGYIVFDANENERIRGEITFISPISTEIEGVAYFEGHLKLENQPEWIREGLNADVDIIVEERTNVLRLPKRFLLEENGVYSASVLTGSRKVQQEVEIGLVGNDGYVEVRGGLDEGTTVITS